MDKERNPEERMNQGPLVPEQIGNLQKTKKKTLIMKMLEPFLVALLVLSSVIVAVFMYGHHLVTKSFERVKTEPKQEVRKRPEPQIRGGMMLPIESRIAKPEP